MYSSFEEPGIVHLGNVLLALLSAACTTINHMYMYMYIYRPVCDYVNKHNRCVIM